MVTVYHCAAMVSFNGSDRNTLLETNIKGTENICKICLERGVRLCFVSSIAALGDAPNESVVIDENTPEISGSVHSLYSGSKGESEKIVWEYVRQGLDVVIVNPAMISCACVGVICGFGLVSYRLAIEALLMKK